MSQITRCPSCSTTFKVVADQLRISEGWVRCGQCKEVFDASAHLLLSTAQPLLPDVSLTDVRPPPAPVVRRPEPERAWGAPPPPAQGGVPPQGSSNESASSEGMGASSGPWAAPSPAITPPSSAAEPPRPPPAAWASADVARLEPWGMGAAGGPFAPASSDPVMEVPHPAVPAFLAAGGGGLATSDEERLELQAPFVWRVRSAATSGAGPASAPNHEDFARESALQHTDPLTGPATDFLTDPVTDLQTATSPLQVPLSPPPPTSAFPQGEPLQEVPAGYELPAADLSDFEIDALDISPSAEARPLGPTPTEAFPSLDLRAGFPQDPEPSAPLPGPPDAAESPGGETPVSPGSDALPSGEPFLLPSPPADTPALADDAAAEGALASAVPRAEGSAGLSAALHASPSAIDASPASADEPWEADVRAGAPLPVVEFPGVSAPGGHQALALVEDDSPTAVLQPPARRKPRSVEEDEEEDAAAAAAASLGFVQAARRKAFWTKPAVRGALLLALLLAVVALALQVAVQERDRIAAMDGRARPWLAQLCVPLRCKIAPPRQIDDVVIDSSSFTKARGDSYQLALTVKSKAAVAVAMPAVELTLTDAQDQAVLRRVLQPADLGAPAELPARGEWSTSVAVIVTTGGARVAGYRLLVFYP